MVVSPRGPSLRAAEMVSVVTAQDAAGKWWVRAGMLWGRLQGRGQPSSVCLRAVDKPAFLLGC